jgi:hypothetical protein
MLRAVPSRKASTSSTVSGTPPNAFRAGVAATQADFAVGALRRHWVLRWAPLSWDEF